MTISPNLAKGITQLLENAEKLLDVYQQSKEESLVPIIKGLLDIARLELVEAENYVVYPGLPPSFPVSPPGATPIQPWVQPSIVAYAAGMEDSWYPYVGDTTTTCSTITTDRIFFDDDTEYQKKS